MKRLLRRFRFLKNCARLVQFTFDICRELCFVWNALHGYVVTNWITPITNTQCHESEWFLVRKYITLWKLNRKINMNIGIGWNSLQVKVIQWRWWLQIFLSLEKLLFLRRKSFRDIQIFQFYCICHHKCRRYLRIYHEFHYKYYVYPSCRLFLELYWPNIHVLFRTLNIFRILSKFTGKHLIGSLEYKQNIFKTSSGTLIKHWFIAISCLCLRLLKILP